MVDLTAESRRTQILLASIENVGCDETVPGEAVLNTDIIATTYTNFVTNPNPPTTETSSFEGWSPQYPAVAQWKGTLSGPASDYNGRQVTEEPGNGAVTDSCYFNGSMYGESRINRWNLERWLLLAQCVGRRLRRVLDRRGHILPAEFQNSVRGQHTAGDGNLFQRPRIKYHRLLSGNRRLLNSKLYPGNLHQRRPDSD